MNRQAGRSGHRWQNIIRPAVLRAAHGICALCHSATCPTCGRQACGGTPPPGQVDHLIPPDIRPDLAEEPANLRAAHGHCNRARNRFGATPTIASREW
jgi:5-methylcytosine-specific restriction endonuclease McrA